MYNFMFERKVPVKFVTHGFKDHLKDYVHECFPEAQFIPSFFHFANNIIGRAHDMNIPEMSNEKDQYRELIFGILTTAFLTQEKAKNKLTELSRKFGGISAAHRKLISVAYRKCVLANYGIYDCIVKNEASPQFLAGNNALGFVHGLINKLGDKPNQSCVEAVCALKTLEHSLKNEFDDILNKKIRQKEYVDPFFIYMVEECKNEFSEEKPIPDYLF